MIEPEASPEPHHRTLPVVESARGAVAHRSTCPSSGSTASCSTSWPGATSRCATGRPLLGVAWAVIQPLVTMVVFSVFFGRLAEDAVRRRAVPVFAFARSCRGPSSPRACTQAANSLVGEPAPDHEGVLPAPRHPDRRASSPASSTSRSRSSCCSALMLVLRHRPGLADGRAGCRSFLLLALVTALGVGLWLSALNVQLPRRPLRGAVPRPALAVRDAGRLSEQPARRAVAHAVRPQPDGRRRRGLPLGAARHGDRAGADDRSSRAAVAVLAARRPAPFVLPARRAARSRTSSD